MSWHSTIKEQAVRMRWYLWRLGPVALVVAGLAGCTGPVDPDGGAGTGDNPEIGIWDSSSFENAVFGE